MIGEQYNPEDGQSFEDWVLSLTLLEQILLAQFASTLISATLWPSITRLESALHEVVLRAQSSQVPGSATPSSSIISQANRIIDNEISSLSKSIANQTIDAMTSVAKHQAAILRGTDDVAKAAGRVVEVDRIRRIVDEVLIEGAPSAEWWSKQAENTKFKFALIARAGVEDGATPGVMRNDVRAALNVLGHQAEALTRTSVLTATNAIRDASIEANIDAIDKIGYLATLDGRTTPQCRQLDGKTWEAVSKKPIGHDFQFRRPPLHWNCRSVLVPIPKPLIAGFEAPVGRRASAFGPVSGALTFETWLDTLTKKQFDQVLGASRAKLFAEGKVSFSQLIDARGRQVSLAKLQALLG